MRTTIRCASFIAVLSWATVGHGAPAGDGDADEIGAPAGRGDDDFGGPSPGPSGGRPTAVDSAFGTPSPGAQFTPDTDEDAGFVERERGGTDRGRHGRS